MTAKKTKNAKNTTTIKNTALPASGETILIPLNKLKKSPRNARKTPHPKADIEALAASIAVHGLLQNPVVEPEQDASGRVTGCYLVTIGEGRRLAQLLRAKRKEIAKSEPIRCVLDTAHKAYEISLAENTIRSAMHPADQFDAFFKLHSEHGMNAEDIAARFGVTATVVRQRLKLAAISPALLQVYREGAMNLDELSAFAITDDHAKQETVWAALSKFDHDRELILNALNEDHVPALDRRAVFVGLEAYEAAGGVIVRDLFSEEGDGYLADAVLLDRLAQGKLEAMTASVDAEGWKWVARMPKVSHGFTSDMRRVRPEAKLFSDTEAAQLNALEAEQAALEDDDSAEAAEEGERIAMAIAALGGELYAPADLKRAGAIVTLDAFGNPRIERGFIRPEDDTPGGTKKNERSREDGPAPLPEKLVAELTAYRTLGLRHTLAQQPEQALTAVIHALVASLFYPYAEVASCLEIKARSHSLACHAEGIEDDAAATEIASRHAAWAQQLPDDPVQLWEFIAALGSEGRMTLMAHCAALSINAVRAPAQARPEQLRHADALAEATGLDMHAYWKPTAARYLGRVTKERILEAVTEGASKSAADNIAGMKKQIMAEAAAQRLADSAWLPPLLRAPHAGSAPLAIAAE